MARKPKVDKFIVKSIDGEWFYSGICGGAYSFSDKDNCVTLTSDEANEIVSSVTTMELVKVAA